MTQVLRNKERIGHRGAAQVTGGRWGSHPYVLRLKDVADHLVLPLSILGRVGGFHVLLGVGARHAPAGHQHDDVPDVCDVGDGPQRVVHHRLLEGGRERVVSPVPHPVTHGKVCHPEPSQVWSPCRGLLG